MELESGVGAALAASRVSAMSMSGRQLAARLFKGYRSDDVSQPYGESETDRSKRSGDGVCLM